MLVNFAPDLERKPFPIGREPVLSCVHTTVASCSAVAEPGSRPRLTTPTASATGVARNANGFAVLFENLASGGDEAKCEIQETLGRLA
jgi:hypothetical protein